MLDRTRLGSTQKTLSLAADDNAIGTLHHEWDAARFIFVAD
jgi:hypothetical protein